MKKQSENIKGDNLIVKFLNGDITEIESVEFEAWLKNDPINRTRFEELRKIWDHSNSIIDFQSIDAIEGWSSVKQRINFKENRSLVRASLNENLFKFWRIAAAFIIILGIGILVKQYVFSSPEIISVRTAELVDVVLLPDGSRIHLNKNSELIYPEKFHGKSRQISLSGEAFLDVAQSPKKPFQINVNDKAVVEVLGTSFNIKSDNEVGTVNVSVVSGKVAFYTLETESNKTILMKDEQALMQNGVIDKIDSNIRNVLSWKTGILYFENEIIGNVFNDLAKFYDKEFILENITSEDLRFTSTFDNQDLESVLEEMKLVLDLNYSKEGDKIFIYRNQKVSR